MNPIKRWIIKREVKKMFQLSKGTHGIVQVLLTILNVASAVAGFVPAEYKPIAVAAISLVQAVLAVINHGSTPVTQEKQ